MKEYNVPLCLLLRGHVILANQQNLFFFFLNNDIIFVLYIAYMYSYSVTTIDLLYISFLFMTANGAKWSLRQLLTT